MGQAKYFSTHLYVCVHVHILHVVTDIWLNVCITITLINKQNLPNISEACLVLRKKHYISHTHTQRISSCCPVFYIVLNLGSYISGEYASNAPYQYCPLLLFWKCTGMISSQKILKCQYFYYWNITEINNRKKKIKIKKTQNSCTRLELYNGLNAISFQKNTSACLLFAQERVHNKDTGIPPPQKIIERTLNSCSTNSYKSLTEVWNSQLCTTGFK